MTPQVLTDSGELLYLPSTEQRPLIAPILVQYVSLYMFNMLNLAGSSSSHVDPLLLEMTVETLENDVKKLREENAYLLEEVKSM